MKIPSKYCMLIDDDPDEQEIFLVAAQEVNPDVIWRYENDPKQALASLRQSFELPDLIFLDINMPKMDGFEFITHLKRDERLRPIQVIFYSTTKDEIQIKKASTLGALAFVTKTTNHPDLCNVLRMFLNYTSICPSTINTKTI